MIENIIFGKKSILTDHISKKIKPIKIYSVNSINNYDLNFSKGKKNIIFNSFYPSFRLNNLTKSNYSEFIELSIYKLGKILQNLDINQINKIIYTSSSSVYNLIDNLENLENDKFNRILYSTFKFSAETLIQNFCKKNKIKFHIIRIFNTYGDSKDKFSFIEKLIEIKKKKSPLILINNGMSLRDFIHLSDISTIYKKFLDNDYPSGVYDLGTGKSCSIKDLIDYISIDKKKIIHKKNINEINKSTADTSRIIKCIGSFKFKSLEDYIKQNIQIKKNKKIIFFEKNSQKIKYEGSAIYGAGFAGKELYSKLIEQKEKVLFFIDDEVKKQSQILFGLPVLSFDDLKYFNKKNKITRVYVAIPSLNKFKINILTKKLNNYFFDIRILPEKKYIIDNQINLNDLNIKQISSFINRDNFKRKKIKNLKSKTVMVTGAAGSIGLEICNQLIYQKAKRIIAVDQSEINIYSSINKFNKKINFYLGNLNNYEFIDNLIKKNNVDLIIHAAAYKHVNILEKNPISAIHNNIIVTDKICDIALKNNCNFILISTDKAAEPTTVLGYTKKISELLVILYRNKLKKNKFFNIVRFGNVFGSSGSAIIKFIDQINNNEPVTITHKRASRYFMTILEASYLVLETTGLKLKNKTFVLNMGKQLKMYDLAKKISLIKQKIDPNYKFSHVEIGLKKNEKLREKLFDRSEKKLRINKNIFYVKKNKFDEKKFINYFNKLKFLTNSNDVKKLKKLLKQSASF